MKLFNATHISKATGNTLLLVYSTCLAQGGGRLELIVPLKLKGRSEGCSQSQDTRSAVIGEAQNS